MKWKYSINILLISIIIGLGQITWAYDQKTEAYLKEYGAEEVKEIDNYEDLVNYLYTCFMDYKGAAIAYTGKEQIGVEDINKLFTAVCQIDQDTTLNDCEGLWGNVNSYNKMIATTEGYTLICIQVNYKRSRAEMTKLEQQLEKVIASWGDLSTLDEEEKVKKVHDYVCQTFDYDESLTNYDEYAGYFEPINGKQVMVCQGYALLTYKLCNKIGIKCKILMSTTHSWNMVQLQDGYWYQVDCTNDDRGIYGEDNTYDHFLKATLEGDDYKYLKSCILYSNLDSYSFGKTNRSRISLKYFFERIKKGDYKYLFSTLLRVQLGILMIYSLILFVIINVIILRKIQKWQKKETKTKEKDFDKYNSI